MRIRAFALAVSIGLAAVAGASGQPSTVPDSLDLARADSVLAERQYGPAIMLYRAYLARHPDSFAARYGIARGFLYQGEPDRALPFLHELTHDFPEEPDPRVVRGYAYLQLGRIDPALEDFQWVTDRFPDYSDAWEGLGRGLERSGELRRASEVYSRWIRAEPQHAGAYVARARVYEALGRDRDAEADLELARQRGAPPSDLRAIQDQIDTRDWHDEIQAATGYEFESFGGRRERWESYRAELLYRVQERGTVLFEYERATRHGLWDRAVRGDVFAELWTLAHVHLYWKHGLDREFLPVNDVYVELFQGMQDGWVPSAFFRRMSFTDVRADFYGVGLQKYAGKWLVRTRFSLVDVRDRRNPVIQTQARYYIETPDTYVALYGGYGREVVSVDAVGTVESISNTAVGIFAQTFFWDHLGLGLGASYSKTEVLPNRGGLAFRLMSRF